MLSDEEARDLNESVARAMGWFQPEDEEGLWVVGASLTTRHLPDFARDPHSLGWMVVWCDAEGVYWDSDQSRDRQYMVYLSALFGGDGVGTGYYGSLGQALARAITAYVVAKGGADAD